jgi:hypothetical protein
MIQRKVKNITNNTREIIVTGTSSNKRGRFIMIFTILVVIISIICLLSIYVMYYYWWWWNHGNSSSNNAIITTQHKSSILEQNHDNNENDNDINEIPSANFTDRSWMLPHERIKPPWKWTAYKTPQELKSRLLYKYEIDSSSSKFCSLPHGGENTTLINKIGIPFFSYRDKTIPIHTLADAISLLLLPKSPPQQQDWKTTPRAHPDQLRITFLGDSTMTSLYFGAGCHLAKNNHVTFLRDRRDIEFTKGNYIQPLTSFKWQKFYVYFDALRYRNHTIQLLNVRSDALPISKANTFHLCNDTDMLIILLGLHYDDAHIPNSWARGAFINDTESFFKTIRSCMLMKPVIWLTPVAQHFPNRTGGVFSRNDLGNIKHSCKQWQDPVEEIDWVLPILKQSGARNNINVKVVPLGRKNSWKSVEEENDQQPTLYVIPWFDITSNLFSFHKNEVSVIYDCTHHPTGLTSVYDPIWDGIYLAISHHKRFCCGGDDGDVRLQQDILLTSDLTNDETSKEYHQARSNIQKLNNKRMRKGFKSYPTLVSANEGKEWISYFDFIPEFMKEKEYPS